MRFVSNRVSSNFPSRNQFSTGTFFEGEVTRLSLWTAGAVTKCSGVGICGGLNDGSPTPGSVAAGRIGKGEEAIAEKCD